MYIVRLILGAMLVYAILNSIIEIDKNRLLAFVLCLFISVILNVPF